MAADGSRNHAPGGGGRGQGPGPGEGGGAAGGGPSSARLRAEEVVERGLRLYAHGDLVGALAEWRRALEIDQGNRRGRDYLTYVENHFELLSEKFRAARERRGTGGGTAIEVEAGDPMDDIDPYESMQLEGGLALNIEVEVSDGEPPAGEVAGQGAAPGAPQPGSRAPGGKPSAGRTARGRRPEADADEPWPAGGAWPPPRNDTLEMNVEPSFLDDLDLDSDEQDTADLGGTDDDDDDDDDEEDDDDVEDDDGSEADDDAAEELDAELFAAEPLDGDPDVVPEGKDGEAEADAADREPGTGEITLPVRRRRRAGPGLPAAEGSGPLGPGALEQVGGLMGERREFDLSDFGSGAALVDAATRRAEEEAWADGTPVADGSDAMAEVRELRDDELREVRVTFRRPGQSTAPPGTRGARQAGGQREADDDSESAADPIERRGDLGLRDEDDEDGDVDEYDEDERTTERRSRLQTRVRQTERPDERVPTGASGEAERLLDGEGGEIVLLQKRRRDRDSGAVASSGGADRVAGPGRPDSVDGEADRATTELAGRDLPMSHSSVSIDLVSGDLAAELDEAMAAAGHIVGGEVRTRERVVWLIERARHENLAGHYPLAVVALDLALAENPESAVVQKLIHSNRELLFEIYGNYLGDMSAVPALALPMSAIPVHELDHRAAFLLSRVDGVLSLEDVLDVSGMARLEAFRHLTRLMLRGILEIRP